MIENCISCNAQIRNADDGQRYKKSNGLIFYICDLCAEEVMLDAGDSC